MLEIVEALAAASAVRLGFRCLSQALHISYLPALFPAARVDLLRVSLILTDKEVRGSRLAEMIGAKRRSNPLNLMRVMPPKEAR
jgi:hypothetical protein